MAWNNRETIQKHRGDSHLRDKLTRPILCVSDGRPREHFKGTSYGRLELELFSRSSRSRSGETLWRVAIFTDMQLFHANDKNLHVTRYRFNANNIWTLSDALSIRSLVYSNLADCWQKHFADQVRLPLRHSRTHVHTCNHISGALLHV